MLKIRIIILSVGLVAVLMLAAQLVNARTEAASNPASDATGLPDTRDLSASPNSVDFVRLYRSSLGECFDVPLSEAAACLETGQANVHSYRSPLDECFDVSIWEAASCRNQSQAPTP